MATKKFKCNVCGYIHEGDAAPANCPVCGVPASEFTELKPEKKGLFSDKNGNAYIIMYSTVMVVIVATLLALAALGLQKRQYENELNEKKHAILASLSAGDRSYDEFIDAYVVDQGRQARRRRGCLRAAQRPAGNLRGGQVPDLRGPGRPGGHSRDRHGSLGTCLGLCGSREGHEHRRRHHHGPQGRDPGSRRRDRDAQVPGQFRRQDDLRRRPSSFR